MYFNSYSKPHFESAVFFLIHTSDKQLIRGKVINRIKKTITTSAGIVIFKIKIDINIIKYYNYAND